MPPPAPPGGKGRASWTWRGAAIASGALFVVLTGVAAHRETPTIDEFAHVPAGCAYWRQGAFELYDKNPPLGRLWIALPVVLDPRATIPPFSGNPLGWGPWIYAQGFMDANRAAFFSLFFHARLMVALLGLATGALLFAWARALFGERAAGATTALFLLSPTVLAHAHLATVDVACMLTIFLACLALRWARYRGDLVAVAMAGAACGVAMAVKFTAVLLIPAALVVLALPARAGGKPLRLPSRAGLPSRAARWGRDAAILLATALVVVHAAYGFDGSFRRLDGFTFHSRFCRGVQAALPGALRTPLPRAYVSGFDAVKLDTESGEFDTFLRGRWSREGSRSYNLVALAVKTPIPVLLLAAAGIVLWRRRVRDPAETWPVLLPAALLFVSLSLFNRVNTGVRYVLPLYPFLHLAVAAALAEDRRGAGQRVREAVAWTAVVAGLVVALHAHPDHLAYFNAVAGGTEHGHEWLLDSNLDWGQDLYRVPAEVARLHPVGPIGLLYFGHVDPALYGLDYVPVPPVPVEGVLAVSVSFVAGQQYLSPAPGGKVVWVRAGHASWLRSHAPVARAGAMWIYDTRRR